MNLRDIIAGLTNGTGSSTDDTVPHCRASELAEAARSETVTTDGLTDAGTHTQRPLVEYLQEDELPEFLLRAGRLVVVDGEDTVSRKHPSLEQVVLVTDRRILFVIGQRFSDDVLEIPIESVVAATVDDYAHRRDLVVEADHEGVPMTFVADVRLEANRETIDAAVRFVESNS